MIIYRNFLSDFICHEKIVFAIGMFDGVHIGHRKVLNSAKNLAKIHNARFGAFTFCGENLSFFKNKQLIYPYEYRRELLENFGVEILCEQIFSSEFSSIAAGNFPTFLRTLFPNLCGMSVGYDFRFGKNALGNVEILQDLFRNLDVFVVDPVEFQHEKVSSTRIRHELQSGNLFLANKLLGENFISFGKIIEINSSNDHIFFICNLDFQVLLPAKKYLTAITLHAKKISATAEILSKNLAKIEVDLHKNNIPINKITDNISTNNHVQIEWIT